MEHLIELRTEDNDFGIQFIEKIEPPVMNKKITVHAEQQIEITGDDGTTQKDYLTQEKDFWIAGRAFTLDLSDVYSVSPGDHDSGNFSNQLPHITLRKKTLPWEYETANQEPWLALITVTDEEHNAKDITIAELKRNETEEIYFPVSAQPAVYLEKDSELCHVIDLETKLFQNIAPRKGERALLTHGEFVNLLEKTDDTLEMDGYFSGIIGGRFVPSGKSEAVKSTIHLVSMLGYDDLDKLPGDCRKVRLVSLYHWTVFSKEEEEAGFISLMSGLKCDSMRIAGENQLLAHGYIPKHHVFRSGESTISLYRGPLTPFPVPSREDEMKERIPKTADGALIFDKKTALFDASYSAAWQLGRMLTVQNKPVAQAMVKWRKQVESGLRKRCAEGFLEGILMGCCNPAELAETAARELISDIGIPEEET
ncbi:hypothetical protein NXH76_08970 [Blautia schinkii]|nr:hypothetical protein [Blautia schinkii]